MANRYNRPLRLGFDFASTPPEYLEQTYKTLQDRYNQNLLDTEQVKNNFIPSLEKDRQLADKIQSEWEQKASKITDAYKGDYAQASKDLFKLKSEIAKSYKTGDAAAITDSLKQYQDWQTRSLDRLKKGEITEDDYRGIQQYTMNNYQGVQKNPLTGEYSKFQPIEVAEYVNKQKDITDTLSKLKPRKTKVPKVYSKDGYNYVEYTEKEIVDPKDVEREIQGVLLSDNKYIAHAKQQAMLYGVDPLEYINKHLEATTAAFLPSYSGEFLNSTDIKREVDQYALERQKSQSAINLAKIKGGIDRDNIKYKHDLENPVIGDNLSFLGLKRTADLPDLQLDNGLIKAPYDVPTTPIYNPLTGVRMNAPTEAPKGFTSTGLVNDVKLHPEKYKDVIDPTLLEVTYNGLRGKLGREISSEELLQSYNTSKAKDTTERRLSFFPVTDFKKQGRPMAEVAANTISEANSVHVYDPISQTFSEVVDPQQRKAYADDVRTQTTNNKYYGAMGTLDPSSSGVIGSLFKSADGKIITFANPNERIIDAINPTLRAATRTFDEPFQVNTKNGGSNVFIRTKERRFDPNSNTADSEIIYKVLGPNGYETAETIDEVTKKRRNLSSEEITNMIIPRSEITGYDIYKKYE